MTDHAAYFSDEPENALPELSLEQLPERLRDAAQRAGWPSLMPVQARALPYLLAGRQMIVQARTGSGKTGAFLLPMLQRLDPELKRCQALILVPTRELARQVAEEVETLCSAGGFHSVVLYGGVGYGPQVDALKSGAQIVVGTPGRVLDHLLKRNLSLEHLQMLVFDEADRMLSMGFYPDMKAMQRHLPKRKLQACMFSATFPPYVLRTAREFISHPEFLTLSSGEVHVSSIEHVFYEIPGMEKDRTLVRLIELENPASAIIFCNTKARVHYVSTVLQRFGYDADELSADLSQRDRERVLERVRKGTLRFLVATDVAARGLDIPDLSHVFQYEPPEDSEAYIHRVGRTGRAGASGVAIALVSGIEKLDLNRIAKRYGIDLQERPLPTDEDVEAVVSERLTALLEAQLRLRDTLQTDRSRRFANLARTLAESEDETDVICMLLDEYYQQSLHAPVAQPPAAPPPPPAREGRESRESREGREGREPRKSKRRGGGSGGSSESPEHGAAAAAPASPPAEAPTASAPAAETAPPATPAAEAPAPEAPAPKASRSRGRKPKAAKEEAAPAASAEPAPVPEPIPTPEPVLASEPAPAPPPTPTAPLSAGTAPSVKRRFKRVRD